VATHTSPSELLVMQPPGSLDTEEMVGVWVDEGCNGGQLTQHEHRQTDREERGKQAGGWRTVLSSFSTDDFPGSYSKMLLGSARYFLVSTFLSGGSHSFLWRGGCQGGVGCGIGESQSLSSGLHGNQHRLRCFFNLFPIYFFILNMTFALIVPALSLCVCLLLLMMI